MYTDLKKFLTLSNNLNSVAGIRLIFFFPYQILIFLNKKKKKKKMKLSKSQSSFQSMEVENESFTAFIDVLTQNTYIMVIMSDPDIRNFSLFPFFYFIFLSFYFPFFLFSFFFIFIN